MGPPGDVKEALPTALESMARRRGGQPPSVLHIITGLATGGAEMMLWKLLAHDPQLRTSAHVLSLSDIGTVGPRIQALGVPVSCAGMRRGLPGPTAWRRIRALYRQVRPDVVQGWMYHGNLAATALAWADDPWPATVLWNIRQSFSGFGVESLFTRGVIYAGAKLSGQAARIIYNSEASASQHEAIGFAAAHRCIIPNGFDTQLFRPDPLARVLLRDRLGIAADTPVVGLVARNHPMKNHVGFLEAAAMVVRSGVPAHFLLAGRGVCSDPAISRAVMRLNLQHQAHLFEEEREVSQLLAGLDLACSASSWGEGFPNVVGEAMACGVPCIVTDVGDSARVVGDAGVVVAPRNVTVLAGAIAALLGLPADVRAALGAQARGRIEREFSLASVARQYADLYHEVAPRPL